MLMPLTDLEIERLIADGLAPLSLTGQRVLLIVPDATRTFPLPQLYRRLLRHLRPRARAVTVLVMLATGLSADECQAIHLGHRDPATIDPTAWAARGDPEVLVLPHAGEHLYRPRA